MRENIKGLDDALWWSITTLSTVGYGDLYPITPGGRIVAAATLALGVGILGTLGGTIATMFLDFREQGRRGLRAVSAKDHLLVLGWNEKARAAILEFRADSGYVDTKVVIVAGLEEDHFDDAKVRFVRGEPCSSRNLERADAAQAAAAIVLGKDPSAPHSDHQHALTVMALRRINPKVRISTVLVSSANRDHLDAAGCDTLIDAVRVASGLLVQGVSSVAWRTSSRTCCPTTPGPRRIASRLWLTLHLSHHSLCVAEAPIWSMLNLYTMYFLDSCASWRPGWGAASSQTMRRKTQSEAFAPSWPDVRPTISKRLGRRTVGRLP